MNQKITMMIMYVNFVAFIVFACCSLAWNMLVVSSTVYIYSCVCVCVCVNVSMPVCIGEYKWHILLIYLLAGHDHYHIVTVTRFLCVLLLCGFWM